MMRSLALLTMPFLVLGACTGGPHRKGDRQAVFTVDYSEPMLGTSLGFDGHGDARNVGTSAGVQWFLMDRWAVGVRTGLRYYDQRGGATGAWEVEMTARHYFFEIGKMSFGFEMTGGGSLATRDVPPGGTSVNWVWGFGPLFEDPLAEKADLLFGYQWRHLSNGLGGDSPDNPTQNGNRLWIGVGFDW